MARLKPSFNDIQKAANRIAPYVEKTPILTSRAINQIIGGEFFFKCENFQKVGAFKFRGACNAVFNLSENETAAGVATHSSGNHGAALALAGKLRGIPVHVVMPENAVNIKKKAVMGYGANITFCESTLPAREFTLKKIVDETGCKVIHPYNDESVIAGQGTAALELLQDLPDLDVIMVPIGGGGLASGTCIVAHEAHDHIAVVGVEPKGADDAFLSLKNGEMILQTNPQTMADGLLTSLGDKTWPIIHHHMKKIMTVSEEGIIRGMRLIWEKLHMIIEPSSAVVLGALMEAPDEIPGKRIGIILSGGNADPDHLPW